MAAIQRFAGIKQAIGLREGRNPGTGGFGATGRMEGLQFSSWEKTEGVVQPGLVVSEII